MKHRFDGYNHIVRLERGEKLSRSQSKDIGLKLLDV